MKIIRSGKAGNDTVAIGIDKNKVFLVVNNKINKKIEDMSIKSLLCEDWVADALLNMEISKIEDTRRVDKEFDELASLLD